MGLLFWRKKRTREIFRYHDGQRERGADPLRVIRSLSADPEFKPEETPKDLASGEADIASVAADVTATAMRNALGIAEYDDRDESGLTDTEVLQIFGDFCNYVDGLKKTTESRPIWPTPSPVSSAPLTTKPTADSTSTETVVSCAEAMGFSKESLRPWLESQSAK